MSLQRWTFVLNAFVLGVLLMWAGLTSSSVNARAAAEAAKKTAGCDCCKCKNCACEIPLPMPAKGPVIVGSAKPAAERVSFEEALRDQIESRPETIRSRRILNVLEMEDGPRRSRILARMERHAIVHLELKGDVGAIDWGAIDWGALFEKILKLLALLLPLLI